MAKRALLIGVSEYEPGLKPLPAAVKDLEAMQRVLLDPEMGEFDEVKPLPNPDRQMMEDEIEALFFRCTREDLVLLFFSGHGIKDDRGRLYFATRITRKNKKGDLVRSSAVSTRFVHEIMDNSRCRRQAIILDCCFSGAFDPALQAKDDGSVDLRSQLGAEGRVVLTSSSSTEYSFEQKEAELSIYTRYLVEGIETGAGDANEDGFVSVLELHEYAASKVQETAPQMTPKIIVLKDKGFEIVLAKARIADPKLKYRKEASRYASAGMIRPAGRYLLDEQKLKLGLTDKEAAEIEAEVLRPYQERLVNLQKYREALVAEAEHEYPLSGEAHEGMSRLQELLGLRDEDILPIQQEVETQFAQQSAAYQQNLVQYEHMLTEAIQRDFPFSQETRQELGILQQSLGLRDEDIARLEQPLIEQAELWHQEKLRQEAEQQQRQEQERAEYEDKLQRYEQEFSKAIQAEYPFGQHVSDELKSFQAQLRLKDEDIARIERPLRESKKLEREAYENNLQRYEQEFSKAIQAEYPLSQYTSEGLKQFQQQLGLKDKDILSIEQPLRKLKEADYQRKLREEEFRRQEKLKQEAEAERQRQIELKKKRRIEEQRKQAEAQRKTQEQAKTSKVSRDQNYARNQLQRFTFDVITVDTKGKENSRTKKSAEFFAEYLGNGVLLEMVKIPGGTFQMGSSKWLDNGNEKPQHAVRVPAFLMGKYPVTQAQWRAVADLPQVQIALNTEPSNFKGDDRPVEQVSWHEAVEFCQRLSRVTGHPYRLPSEAEWEYACRAGTTTEFYFGETLTPKLARCKANLGMVLITIFAGETASVGKYLPNPFGLYDMHGNVWEWCADHWHGNYTGAPTDGTAWIVDGDSEKRICRGGCSGTYPALCRAAYRHDVSPAYRDNEVGFRVVCAVFPLLL